ncbi:MAG TPA: T9SS type A sorting domain-containing protein [Bacteroidia bacterium]|nr:T9SS type A sorting domain-containing protein [Bacteroidia bacterium]
MNKILQTKIILAAIMLITSAGVNAQWINSITHVPLNPTSTDTIYFYTDLSFPSGNCNEHTQFSGVLGQNVYAGAVHCLGMLTFICSYTDTFKIDPLPAGVYNFTFQVLYGGLPSPCTPTSAGVTDSIPFTVSSASAVPSVSSGTQDFMMLPNPAGNTIKLNMTDKIAAAKNKSLVIYSVEGKEIRNWGLENNKLENEIDISYLNNGIYLCNVVTENYASEMVKLIVIK